MNVSFVYMIRCEDNSLYTGIAKDLERRLSEHFWQKKECAKYTKTHKMVKLEAAFTAQSWSEAARLEYAIKRLSKQQKERLVAEPGLVQELSAGRLGGCIYQPVDCSQLSVLMLGHGRRQETVMGREDEGKEGKAD